MHPCRSLLPLGLLLVLLVGCSSPPPPPEARAVATVTASRPPININTAILSELDTLEGQLGIPALSNRIQAARPYASTEELVSKKVLTQAQFDQVKDQVSVEEVVLTGQARDVAYLTKLGLMRGHLLVAQELLVRRRPEQALPHIGHPIEEIYLDVEDQLNERQVPEFKSALLKLQDLVRFKPTSPEIAPGLQAALAAIDRAIAAVPATERAEPAFTLQVIGGLLDAAAAEYSAAVSGNKIVAQIEYEDSRGFVLHANELFARIAPALGKSHPKSEKVLAADLRRLSSAWPGIEPPGKPILSVSEVTASIQAVERTSKAVVSA
ncbi:ComEA family DNA-binding protein [Gloeobacter kilaueensis]|uniref:DNA uptake protein n=1 Tax=Gloeobacter kilaueensis (strain ATCC BAA-2537 / CCAP 1431/1 / ULC 316 / JS1) TaxID=1183438 RepID=U5QMX3_GLOK1|nr:helix-hairpin-helix domain-containing protein [Gloeobacter kilaueensis]AGY60271.1 hypothetical protein GKIL_4025 [Gloeobacter kilaueensis JS1]